MASRPEYNLRDLGPWSSAIGPESVAVLWVSPDPFHPDGRIHFSETFRIYTDDNDEPIYFAGTDPRTPGIPPPDEAIFWSPREVWARTLSTQQWNEYMGFQ